MIRDVVLPGDIHDCVVMTLVDTVEMSFLESGTRLIIL